MARAVRVARRRDNLQPLSWRRQEKMGSRWYLQVAAGYRRASTEVEPNSTGRCSFVGVNAW